MEFQCPAEIHFPQDTLFAALGYAQFLRNAVFPRCRRKTGFSVGSFFI